jgi:hypothetical protein
MHAVGSLKIHEKKRAGFNSYLIMNFYQILNLVWVGIKAGFKLDTTQKE